MIKKLLPLIYAVILFLIIRVTNDIPRYDNYLTHTPWFIAVEIIGVTAACYLCFYLYRRWVEICTARRICPAIEYGCVLVVPVILIIIVTAISHSAPFEFITSPREFIIPTVIVELTTLWLYMFMKTAHTERLYSAELLRNEQLRASQLNTELRLLRAQYHPHFLFNMLNTIYFRIDESNTEARDTVEHLANLLRSQLYSGDDPVSMEQELSAIDSYIQLSSLRIGDRLKLNCHIDPRLAHKEIHPHLLLPLVENAFKHCGGDCHIDISIINTSSGLEMTVINSISPSYTPTHHDSECGLGLKNLQRRLQLLYPDNRHKLMLTANNETFTAHLTLTL